MPLSGHFPPCRHLLRDSSVLFLLPQFRHAIGIPGMKGTRLRASPGNGDNRWASGGWRPVVSVDRFGRSYAPPGVACRAVDIGDLIYAGYGLLDHMTFRQARDVFWSICYGGGKFAGVLPGVAADPAEQARVTVSPSFGNRARWLSAVAVRYRLAPMAGRFHE